MQNQLRWISSVVAIVGLCIRVMIRTGMFHTGLSREPELPNRPFTKADVPLLQEKVKFLKKDAETARSDEAYHFFMSQANSLSLQITALENGTAPTQPDLSAATLAPDAARRYGVVVGDIVDISAVTPPIALHRATLTAMNKDQLTVRDGTDTFSVRWDDLIHLNKASGGK